jgi:hypothetical protein
MCCVVVVGENDIMGGILAIALARDTVGVSGRHVMS